MNSNEDALNVVLEAIQKAGYLPGKDIYLALDVASSEFYNSEKKVYELKSENKTLTSEEMIAFLEKLVHTYPIISIEDGLDQNDWAGWKQLTKRLGKKSSTCWR